jgi:hypothetical protein
MSSSNSKTLRRDLNSILEHSKLGSTDKMTALGLGLEGGARTKKRSVKKTASKKCSAKKSSAKKSSAKKAAPKKRSAKKSSAKKSSAKKSRSMSRSVPPGLQAHIDFVSFLTKDMKVPGGPPIQVVAKMYKDIARDNNPNSDSIELAKLARKVYENEKNKSPKKPAERLETAKKQIIAKKAAKKAKKA